MKSLKENAEGRAEAAIAEADAMVNRAREIAADAEAEPADRAAAARLLGRGLSRQADDRDSLLELLDSRVPPKVQRAAVGSLENLGRVDVARGQSAQ